MMKTRSIESTIGVASIILALSPFNDSLKPIIISKAFKVTITAFHLYFGYAIFFVLFIVGQLYVEGIMSSDTSPFRRIRCQQVLVFGNFLLLTFPPFVVLNLLTSEFILKINPTVDEVSFRNGSFVLLVVAMVVLFYVSEYRIRFQSMGQILAIKEQIREKLRVADQLIGRDRFIEAALLHHEISTDFLSMLPWGNAGTITDRATSAYLKKKISSEQKQAFQEVAAVWDRARLVENSKFQDESHKISHKVIENHVFLQSNIAPRCE